MIGDFKVIPVVVLHDRAEAEVQLGALAAGGLPVAEITFRTDYAEEAIRLALQKYPEICVGAGTVINAAQAKRAIAAGAKFIVSPGISEEVAHVCKEEGIEYLPGCVTPAEIMRAIALGIHTVKFFPANVYGGLAAIRSLSAPFPQVKFVPTGGVDAHNLSDFLAFDKVLAVGGSWMMKGDIVKNCREICEILSHCVK